MSGIAPDTWDSLCGSDDPFIRHAFLAALEESGSATAETGWQPLHLVLREGGAVRGAVPLYAKSHSYGEYVFDWGWAEAYERAGGRYYPKLQAAVPFTPVPGPRLLAPSADDKALLARGIATATEELGASSAHVTFCLEDEVAILEEEGFIPRVGVQYHWHNRGYGAFDDFLGEMRSSRRKSIRRERREVAEHGIRFEILTGESLTAEAMADFYPFYLATVDKRWGNAYLTRAFFLALARSMPERVVLVVALQGEEKVAAALNLLSGETLYGRVWGCLDDFRFLHFETCYYQAIEFAIDRGIARVEAGAQGQHKLQRGYEPVLTHSAHLIRDPGLAEPVRRFCVAEADEIRAGLDEMRSRLPFHRPHQDLPR